MLLLKLGKKNSEKFGLLCLQNLKRILLMSTFIWYYIRNRSFIHKTSMYCHCREFQLYPLMPTRRTRHSNGSCPRERRKKRRSKKRSQRRMKPPVPRRNCTRKCRKTASHAASQTRRPWWNDGGNRKWRKNCSSVEGRMVKVSDH